MKQLFQTAFGFSQLDLEHGERKLKTSDLVEIGAVNASRMPRLEVTVIKSSKLQKNQLYYKLIKSIYAKYFGVGAYFFLQATIEKNLFLHK